MADLGASGRIVNRSRAILNDLSGMDFLGLLQEQVDRSFAEPPPATALTLLNAREAAITGIGGGAMSAVSDSAVISIGSADASGPRRVTVGEQSYLLGMSRADNEGSAAPPCLKFSRAAMWRFRLVLGDGDNTVSIRVKQAANQAPRPSLVVKANPAIGLATDTTASAPAGTGWVTIGPVALKPYARGMVWVELWNNYDAAIDSAPCYFDTLETTYHPATSHSGSLTRTLSLATLAAQGNVALNGSLNATLASATLTTGVVLPTGALTGWTYSGASVDTTLDPPPSISCPNGAYAYRDAGIRAGTLIRLSVYVKPGVALCNVAFGCNSSGLGQMLRLEARPGNTSGIFPLTNWTTWGTGGTGPVLSSGVWLLVDIQISADGTKCSWSLNGTVLQSNLAINLRGTYLGLIGDGGSGGNFQGIRIF